MSSYIWLTHTQCQNAISLLLYKTTSRHPFGDKYGIPYILTKVSIREIAGLAFLKCLLTINSQKIQLAMTWIFIFLKQFKSAKLACITICVSQKIFQFSSLIPAAGYRGVSYQCASLWNSLPGWIWAIGVEEGFRLTLRQHLLHLV